MPKKMEKMVKGIMKSGKSKDSAYAIATAAMKKNKSKKKK